MNGRLVGVFSGKGGTGKTALAAALAAHWAALGKRVVLVDMNIGLRGLDMQMGLQSRIGYDLGDVLEGGSGLDRALVEDTHTGIMMIAARQFDISAPLNDRTLQLILEVLCLQHDYVLLDAPGPMAPGFAEAARHAREALILTTPDDASIRGADRAAALVREAGKAEVSLVVNRICADFVDEGLQYTPEVCAQTLDIPLRGVIPEDSEVLRSTLEKRPLMGLSPAALAVDNLADRMDNTGIALLPWRMPSMVREAEMPSEEPLIETVVTEEAEQVTEQPVEEARQDEPPPPRIDSFAPTKQEEPATHKKRRLLDILRGIVN